jgi:hypothetical protein
MFQEIQDKIAKEYDYRPGGFSIGDVHSGPDENQWSGRVASYAVLNDLSTEQTLALFGEHYQTVLDDPSGTGHANIRALARHGIESVRFDDGRPLITKKTQM